MGKSATRIRKRTANLMLVSKDRILLLRRAEFARNGGHWGLPGGQCGRREMPYQAACREAVEEMALLPRYQIKESLVAQRGRKRCDVFFGRVKRRHLERWVPRLNGEHDAWRWATPAWCARNVDQLHPVLRLLFTDETGLRSLLSAMRKEGVCQRELTSLVRQAQAVAGLPPLRFALAA